MTSPPRGCRAPETPDSADSREPIVPTDEAAIESAEAQLSLLWRRSRAVSYQLAQAIHPDLDPAAYGLLTILEREGKLRLTELAASVGVGKPSVSRQISVLERIGLVSKTVDPLDRRAQLITLTPSGRRRIRSVQSARKKALDDRLAAWPPEDVREFARLLQVFNDGFEQANNPSGPSIPDIEVPPTGEIPT